MMMQPPEGDQFSGPVPDLGWGVPAPQPRIEVMSRSATPADGTYVVEFKTAAGEAMAISIPWTEAAVIWHFQEWMLYGLCVPEVP
jgi:hypothetical protein